MKKGASFGVFTGSGRVAGAARKLGFQTREWEPRLIADSRALFKVQADIRAGLLLGAIVVPPALTFSVACDREGMLRTRFEPWGCQTLSGTNWEKVKDDNACMWSAIRLILFLHAAHLPWVFSQPCSSKVWYLPELIRLQGLDSVQVVQTDSCQWNVPWRRRLQILIGNVSTDDADCCRRLCYGQHGMRSSSSRPHAVIKGSSGLKLAQSYPHPLAHRLAKLYSCSLYGCSFLSPPSQAQANMDLGSMTWARMCINMPLWAFSSAGMRYVVADEPCHCLCSLLRRASDLLRRVPAKSERADMVV